MRDGFEVMQLGHTGLGSDWCREVPRVGACSGAVAAGLCPWGGCPGPFPDGLCSTGSSRQQAERSRERGQRLELMSHVFVNVIVHEC